MVAAGFLPVFVSCLLIADQPQIQLGACLALVIISSGNFDHTTAVIEANAVELLVQLLSR